MILVVLLFIIGSAYSVHAVVPIPYTPINITLANQELYDIWGINGTFEANFVNAKLTLVHTIDLKICFSRFAVPPAPEKYSNTTCELFQQLPAVDKPTQYVLTLPAFRNALYFVGVAPSKNSTVNMTLVLEGTYCNETGQIYNGFECIAPPRFDAIKNIVLKQNENITFFVDIPFQAQTAILDIVQEQNDKATADIQLLGSYLASPFTQAKPDIERYSLPSEFNLPRQGIWYFKLLNTAVAPLKISSITYNQTLWNATALITNYNDVGNLMLQLNSTENGGVMYFQYNATRNSAPLIAVVQSYDTNSTNKPLILVALGQLPQLPQSKDFTTNLDADYVGCNQVDCHTTQRIMAPPGIIPENQTQTWYVAVMATGTQTTHFGFWFGHVCPPLCEIRGQCTYDGDATGLCNCTSVIYSGLDCFTIDHSFTIYDWVLVGIAAALGAITLLGILCFVAMRKHRPTFDKADYQPVSVN